MKAVEPSDSKESIGVLDGLTSDNIVYAVKP